MTRVGIVGFGFMGRMHYRCWKALEGVSITAVCDANPQAFSSSNAAKGNIAGAADTIDFSGIKTFSSFDELLASGVTDVLSITMPTHMHREFTIKALAAGQHVLCEKPMALDVESCDLMHAAANKSGRLLQIGHCVRFWPEYAATREIIKNGKHGKVVAAAFQRFSPMPAWSTTSWLADEKTSGGMPLDLHVHDSDFIQHLFGMPDSVLSTADAQMTHINSSFIYKNGPVVTAEGSWRVTPKFGFKMSFLMTLEKATITYDCTLKPTLKVYPADGEPYTPPIPNGDGYSREIEYFTRKIRGESVEDILTLQQSRDTVRLVLLEKESARKQTLVEVTKA